MKKLVLALVLAGSMVAFAQSNESTDEVGQIGIGYQGIFLGNFFNGISLRYNPAEAPVMTQLIYSRYSGDIDGLGDGSIDIIQGRLAYVLKERDNSKFYLGAKLGYMEAEAGSLTIDSITYGPLFGTEFHFDEMPELGFNFDVGYDFNNMDAMGTDLDVQGINVTFGCHYYF